MLVGNVDITQHDRITGWAADTDAPFRTVDVVVTVGGEEVGRVPAARFRQDLHDLGKYGDGQHGFEFTFGKPLTPDISHDISICFAATGKPLARGLVQLEANSQETVENTATNPTVPSQLVSSVSGSASNAPCYVIHIGLPKTGTKYLQREFCRFRTDMLANGICYPTEFWPDLQIFAHHEMLRELQQQVPNPKLEQVFATLNGSGHRKILISCEGFIGVCKERLEYLCSLLRGSEVRIVFFARRWSDWIPSQWQQTVKQGATETLAEMYARTLATAAGDHGINYNLILDKFSDVFGSAAIQIVPYSSLLDENEDIFACFCRDILDWHPNVPRTKDLVHTSMGTQLTELVRCMNALETRRQGSTGYHLFQSITSVWNDRAVRGDVDRIFAVMDDYTAQITIDDTCYPLRGILSQINERYGRRLVGGTRPGEIFQKRKRVVDFVRTDFLLDESARSAVSRVYAVVAERINTLAAKPAA